MKTIAVHQVDAFTDQIFGGNPAGVVTNADSLSDDEMQKIAREMNLSETAFVLKPSVESADVKLRYFTPTGDEVKFCGHATVGALFQLAMVGSLGLGRPGKSEMRVETNAGVLPMSVLNEDAKSKVQFVAPKVDMVAYHLQGAAFAAAFGVPAELMRTGGTVLLDTVLNYVYVPITSLEMLNEQVFDAARIREQFGQEGIVVFCLFVGETMAAHSDLHARGLAPNVGVDEDPFTGSMQAGLVLAAKRNGLLAADKQHIITEQGHCMGRPGFAEVNHDVEHDRLAITASATHVFSTKMEF